MNGYMNNVATHLAMFGNTEGITNNEPVIDMDATVDKLDRVIDLIGDGIMAIDETNRQLKDTNSFYHLFQRQQEGRDLLYVLHHQQQRLKGLWNYYVKQLML